MNQETLIECIKNPALVKPEHLPVLEELEQKHPHFQAIKILKLKLLKDSSDLSFTDYLKEVALAVPDRYLLYKILLREQVKKQIEQVIEETPKKDDIETPKIDAKPSAPADEPTSEIKPEVPEEKTIEEVLATIKNLNLDSKEDEREAVSDQVLEETQLVNETDSSYEEPTEEVEETAEQETQQPETDKAQIEQLTDAVLDELIKPGSHTLYQIEKVFDSEINQKDDEDEPEEDLKPEKEEKKTSPGTFMAWLEPKKRDTPSSSEIIDRFIQNKPRISKFDKEKSISDKVLKIVDKDDIVTETLARIYIKQKNYQKAIEIYQKLSLNIPEKKGYFASQIHFLEELIKKD